MLREELGRLGTWEERHRRLLARLILAFVLSLVVFVIGTVLILLCESGHSRWGHPRRGDAAFFTAVQLLTVSSGAKNPLTSPGKVVDVVLELWALFVVTAVAGSFALFFALGDKNSTAAGVGVPSVGDRVREFCRETRGDSAAIRAPLRRDLPAVSGGSLRGDGGR